MTSSFIIRLLQTFPAIPAIALLASVAGQDGVAGTGRRATPELALVTDVPSHEGRYVASLVPAATSAWDGSAGWTISLRDAEGDPVDGAALALEAWQPDGGDGASRRASAEPIGAGTYQVDALALGASGWWNVKLAIAGAAGDSLAFNVVLR
ncbi:MAG TPA: FixH family protein [Gemmatimonadales bacterium]